MADVATNLKDWSTTESSNSPSGSTTIGTGLDDNVRRIQATVRADLASKGSDIASTATPDVGAVAGLAHDITGTTTITGLGTVSAGIWKILKFEGALTLTHNATSLIIPTGANITTANGDIAIVMSEGSGNWRVVSYFSSNFPAANINFPAAGGSIKVAGTAAITIASGGEITEPLNPKFLGFTESQITNVTGTGQQYTILPAEIFDSGGDYNAATGTFTAPVTGKYQLQANMRMSGMVATQLSQTVITTSNRTFTNQMSFLVGTTPTSWVFRISILCDMDAADTATASILCNNEAGQVVDIDGSDFSGFLVG